MKDGQFLGNIYRYADEGPGRGGITAGVTVHTMLTHVGRQRKGSAAPQMVMLGTTILGVIPPLATF